MSAAESSTLVTKPMDSDEAEEFRLPTLEEELAQLGLEARPAGAAECDAVASWLLRQLGKAQLEVERRQIVHRKEIELLELEQKRQLEPLDRRIADLERSLEWLALEASNNKWFGKAKSRKTSYGVYGTREQKERITIVDEQRAVAWAAEYCPAAVKVTEKCLISICSSQLLAQLKDAGELPEAFEYSAAAEKPFAKADVTLLAAEGQG
jgi:hypothetical protein